MPFEPNPIAKHVRPALLLLAGAFLIGALTPTSSLAMSGNPAPSVPEKCKKYPAGSDERRRCVQSASATDEVEKIWTVGYELTEEGRYAEALEVLKPAENAGDVRILTYLGFATRKLGDVETALGYYDRALAIDPDYVNAREYLGEAYLQKDDLAGATAQLDEIRARCGTDCEAYTELHEAIEAYKARAS